MDRLKNPALWIGFLVAVLAALLHSGLVADGSALAKGLALVSQILGVAGSLFFGAGLASNPAVPSDQKGSARIGLLVGLALVSVAGCASINKFVCGTTGHLVPPDAQLCTVAALQAASEIAVNVPACAASPTSAACIDAVITAGKDLSPCLPTCVSDAKQGRSVSIAPNVLRSNVSDAKQGRSVSIAPNVLRSNVCQSLAATGHAGACK